MADNITNIVLLQHMHVMKSGLEQQIPVLAEKMGGMQKNMENLTDEVRQGFEEARQHRQALQEDLEATIRMLHKHDTKLARL